MVLRVSPGCGLELFHRADGVPASLECRAQLGCLGPTMLVVDGRAKALQLIGRHRVVARADGETRGGEGDVLHRATLALAHGSDLFLVRRSALREAHVVVRAEDV